MMLSPRLRILGICACALISFSSMTMANDAMTPYTAEYELLRNGSLSGKATISLISQGNGQWRMLSHSVGTQGMAALAGITLKEESDFLISNNALQCQRYYYKQTGLRKRERHVDCNALPDQILSKDHKGEYRFPKREDVIDRQIVSLAIANDLADGKQGTLEYVVVDRERLEPQRFQVGASETIHVPAGETTAIKVNRIREDNNRTTSTWFSPNHGWIPVRILQTEDDKEGLELRLISVKR